MVPDDDETLGQHHIQWQFHHLQDEGSTGAATNMQANKHTQLLTGLETTCSALTLSFSFSWVNSQSHNLSCPW